MRYIIIGAGAVGATIGAGLFDSGFEVVLVARGRHLDALRSDGLALTTPAGSSTLRIPAVGQPGELSLRRDDVLLMTVKTQDAAAVLADWAWQPVPGGAVPGGAVPGGAVPGGAVPGDSVAADSLPVICAQNGVASERSALRRFRRVYGMCVWVPATHLEPGQVEAQGAPLAGMLHLGRYPSGTDEMATQIAADLVKSRFLAPVTPDVMRWKYGKLLVNLGNAIDAVCGRDAGPDAVDLRQRATAEGTAVLAAAGIGYASAAQSAAARDGQVRITPVNGSARAGDSSWQSLARGTGSIEADFLNGEIVLLGRQHGVPTPVNEVLQRLANQAAQQRRAPGTMTPADVAALLPSAPGKR